MIDLAWALAAFVVVAASVVVGTANLFGRAFAVVGVAAAAAVVTGALAAVVPGDPIAALVGEDASDEARAAAAEEVGLGGHDDVPALLRPLAAGGHMLRALASPLTGGAPLRSWRTHEPVFSLIAARLPRTLALGGFGVVVGSCAGVVVGAIAAVGERRRSWAAWLAAAASSVAAATPRFVLGPALIVVVAIGWRALPSGGVDDGWRSWLLPVITLAVPFAGIVARHVRAAVATALDAPFVRSARARGVSEFAVVVRHALPHAGLPVLHLSALQAGALASGAVVVEKVFAFPGLGLLLQESLKKADLPVVEGVVVTAAFAIATAGLAADVIAGFVDPRLRRTR